MQTANLTYEGKMIFARNYEPFHLRAGNSSDNIQRPMTGGNREVCSCRSVSSQKDIAMASVINRGNGHRAIQFENLNGKRKTLGLGKCPAKAADSICTKIEAIIASRLAQDSFDSETARWIATLADSLHERLAEFGLLAPRRKAEKAELEAFIDSFIAGRSDKAAATLSHYQRAKLLLVEFFGANKPMADVTPHDADQFRSWMKSKGSAENTVRGHLKNAKLMFGAAVRARLFPENPFKDISTALVKRPDRMAFVDRETIQKVLEACPTSRWKAIVALCRFGGLRCPSEILALRWTDVDFDRGRMKVRSPKGENFGKGVREVPLFPEVRKALDELYLEPDGGDFVISTNNRSARKNLRTVFEKILIKAGVDQWERIFQNLRSSRETELAQKYSIHLVTAWLGNTPKVAMDHYLQVRDEDFAKAASGESQSGHQDSAAQALQNTSETPRRASHASGPESAKPHVLKAKPTKHGVRENRQAPRLGLEPRT